MKNNADVDFAISDDDSDWLKNMQQIEDYGTASMMPVYGGKLTLGSMISAVFGSRRTETTPSPW